MVDNRNLILAFGLSILVMFGWIYFIDMPRMEREEQARIAAEQTTQAGQENKSTRKAESGDASLLPDVANAPAAANGAQIPGAVDLGGLADLSRSAALARTPRIRIDNGSLHGSISLIGGRLDDLTLANYHKTPDRKSPEIILLSPTGTAEPYYAEFGFVAPGGDQVKVPNHRTQWSGNPSQTLNADSPITLHWDNGEGLVFTRTITLDEHYMFTVTEQVENRTGKDVTLLPYGLVSRHYTPKIANFYILHEGLIGVMQSTLTETKYEDIREQKSVKSESTGGWLGITDKYWLVSVIPDQSDPFTGSFSYNPLQGRDRYQADFLRSPVTVPAGGSAEVTNRLFAGAKKVELIEGYSEDLGIERFDLAIDWGMFYFLTKPLFALLNWFYGLVGNFGLAIILLTIVVKLAFFPLANKSYVAMSKMKKLQPKLMELREKYADDKQKQQQEMMAMYKAENANPLAGCLPIVVQIPVFFALYKVLFVTIEMRHAPFFGWVQDLAARDPTSLFNLFGVVPWTPPEFLMIGVWPVIMGITMFIQQRLNPAPTDPVQEKIFLWMPVLFTFILASFPAGLVIYWTVNNTLSILQQMVIMKREGAPISFRMFGTGQAT